MTTPHASHVEKLMAECDRHTARTLAIEELREQHRPIRYTNPGAPDYPCCHPCTLLAAPRYVGSPCGVMETLGKHGLG